MIRTIIFIIAILHIYDKGNADLNNSREIIITNAVKRIQRDGFPVEVHKITTADGYILSMHRIPYYENGREINGRPVIILMTGIYASADAWLLNGRENSLPYMLSRLGYDVWMGNNRGNIYTRNHLKYTAKNREFWNFSWHEMGVYDLSAMIDYSLFITKQKALHFVGVSQGATIFLVLTSAMPQYNSKIITSQLLAPVAYVSNMEGVMGKIFAPILGTRNYLSIILEGVEMVSTNKYAKQILSMMCQEDEPQRVCISRLWPAVGYDTKYLNMTILPEVMANFPVGGSFKQMMHYLQGYNSGKFRQYDYGVEKNKFMYNNKSPPEYLLERITVPVFVFFSKHDYIVSVKDIYRLIERLPNVHGMFQIPWEKWNHLDFICGIRVKEMIFDKVIDVINKYENRYSKKY